MTGPTGVGKSAFAVALAERLGAEIVGADAFQIYAGLPILTAQPGPDLTARVPHHLIGVLDLQETCHAARYAAMAREAMAEIRRLGKIPLLVGGTGLYLKSLTHGLADLPPADPVLRERIAAMSPPEVLSRLREADPQAPDLIDAKNPVRVRRALEIVLSTGRPLAQSRSEWKTPSSEFRGILLTRERADLRRRIEENVDAMFDEGVIEEVRQSPDAGPGACRAIGYREIHEMLAGRLALHACRAAIVTATHRYAKRQATWCRHQFDFPVLPLSSPPGDEVDRAIEILDAHPRQ